MSAHPLRFETQVRNECRKKRVQVLQQIEIKMVDEAANKGISDFMKKDIEENSDATGKERNSNYEEDSFAKL